MRAIVCIKSVPETTQVRFDPETNTLLRGEVEAIINPLDQYAIETALRLREQEGGSVIALSMGPPKAERELREAVAMGCDDAVLLTARAFAGADTWATAYTLSQAIRQLEPYDLVVCGKQAMDGDTGQVGPGIAKQLGLPQLTYVSRIRRASFQEGTIRVERLVEEGREVVEAPLPAVLTVLKDIYIPRSPTLRGYRRAHRIDLRKWDETDLSARRERLGLEGSPTQVVRIFSPPKREGDIDLMPGDDVDEQADALAERLLQDKVV